MYKVRAVFEVASQVAIAEVKLWWLHAQVICSFSPHGTDINGSCLGDVTIDAVAVGVGSHSVQRIRPCPKGDTF